VCIVDPETRAEFEEMQKKGALTGGQNPAEAIQNFDLASWMAGKTDQGSSRGASPATSKKRS